jgi:ketosteroid isomerase-like protein
VTDEREQLLRRGFELWNARDFESLTEIIDPEVEIDATSRVLNPARYHGIEGFRQLTHETFDIWEEWSVEPTRFLWNGDRVFIETRIHARGKGSGIELAETYYTVWTVENGRGTAMEIHVDRDRAFRSAGLSDHPPDRRDT